VILGAGVVAMEMAQAFAAFGSNVTVVASGSSGRLLSSSSNDDDVISALRTTLENDGVTFLTNVKVTQVKTLTLRGRCDDDDIALPLRILTMMYPVNLLWDLGVFC